MELPRTVEDIEKLIAARVQESLHLDYKRSDSLINKKARSEIAKDVSAFANADGGMIIYGVEERDHLPVHIDGGVDHEQFKRETLEGIITSNIAPRIEDVRISQIPISDSHSLFAVEIPKSFRGPHQERADSKRYYRRFNFQSAPMEDYEIREAYNRRQVTPPLINVDIKIKGFVEFVVANVGTSPAHEVRFEFSEGMRWWEDAGPPNPLREGVKLFPPGRTFYLIYNSYQDLLQNDGDTSKQFKVSVSYFHPELSQRFVEVFDFDLMDFAEAIRNESDTEIMTRELVKEFKGLVGEVRKIEKRLESLSKIASATGLHLSVPTIENLRHIVRQTGEIEKINPLYCSAQAFIEVLKIPRETAWNFVDYFRGNGEAISISQIEGATEEVLERFKHYFIWVEVQKPPPNRTFTVEIKPPTSRLKR